MSTNSINTNGMSMTEIINRTEDLADQNKKTTDIGGNNLIVTTQHDGQLSADDVNQALAVFSQKEQKGDLSESDKKLQQTLQSMASHQEIFNGPSGVSWGNAQVLTENIQKIDPNYKDTTPKPPGESLITTSDGYKNLTQVSHDGQWEAITGGDKDTPLTLDAAKKALTDPKVSGDTKASAQWLVNNWTAVAGDGKSLTLKQAQNLGTTPEKEMVPLPLGTLTKT
jgi:hypothetical protein